MGPKRTNPSVILNSTIVSTCSNIYILQLAYYRIDTILRKAQWLHYEREAEFVSCNAPIKSYQGVAAHVI